MVDLATNDSQRLDEVTCFQCSGSKPDSLHLVTSCLLAGPQNIHRAELAAIVFVCERFFNTLVWTDSQVALSIATKCLDRVALSTFAYHPDLDLVERLWLAVAVGNREFRKVAAHSDLHLATTLDIYHQLGNQCVNDAAIAATTYQLPALRAQLDARANFQTCCQTHLGKLFEFHLEAHYQRALADSAQSCQPARSTPARAIDRPALAAYQVDNPYQPKPARTSKFEASAFGPTLTQAALTWMEQVRWPSQPDMHELQPLGVSWIELALSFMLSTSCWIPVKRQDERGDEALLVPRDTQDVQAHNVKLSELSQSFSYLLKQTLELTDAVPWPDPPKGMVRSLYVLGASVFSQGFTQRPSFPMQQAVQEALDPYLRLHRGPAFETIPNIAITVPAQFWQRVFDQTRGSWTHRCHTARSVWQKIGRWKKQMLGQRQLRFR